MAKTRHLLENVSDSFLERSLRAFKGGLELLSLVSSGLEVVADVIEDVWSVFTVLLLDTTPETM